MTPVFQCVCQTFVVTGEGVLLRQKLLLKANLVLECGNQEESTEPKQVYGVY